MGRYDSLPETETQPSGRQGGAGSRRVMRILVVLAICAVLAVLCLPPLGRSREMARRISCVANMGAISIAISTYQMDYDDEFPTFLMDMYPAYVSALGIFSCPGSTDPESDYIYIHWPSGDKTPDDYPLMYDRLLANHGNGVLVYRMGTRAYGMWVPRINALLDENAEWLHEFARNHPEIDIPLPEDLEIESNAQGR